MLNNFSYTQSFFIAFVSIGANFYVAAAAPLRPSEVLGQQSMCPRESGPLEVLTNTPRLYASDRLRVRECACAPTRASLRAASCCTRSPSAAASSSAWLVRLTTTYRVTQYNLVIHAVTSRTLWFKRFNVVAAVSEPNRHDLAAWLPLSLHANKNKLLAIASQLIADWLSSGLNAPLPNSVFSRVRTTEELDAPILVIIY